MPQHISLAGRWPDHVLFPVLPPRASVDGGTTVLYLRANETGAPAGMNWPTDGLLDPEWSDQLITAAAEHLAE